MSIVGYSGSSFIFGSLLFGVVLRHFRYKAVFSLWGSDSMSRENSPTSTAGGMVSTLNGVCGIGGGYQKSDPPAPKMSVESDPSSGFKSKVSVVGVVMFSVSESIPFTCFSVLSGRVSSSYGLLVSPWCLIALHSFQCLVVSAATITVPTSMKRGSSSGGTLVGRSLPLLGSPRAGTSARSRIA